jgi:glycyl-tRNA synthetase beta chain
MPELLVEFLSEEIPARMQQPAAREIERIAAADLDAARLENSGVKAYATPRRLALTVDGLPLQQPDIRIERKGPRTNAPQQAIDGFLGSTGLGLDQCEVREDKKGPYYVAVIDEAGRATSEILAEIVVKIAHGVSWPKSMRWGTASFRWVRPLHNILAVFDGGVLAGGLDLGDRTLEFSGTTYGHRFRSSGELAATSFNEYRGALESGRVMLDADQRRAQIADGAEALADKVGAKMVDDPGLLAEVAGLVEWPVPLMGVIDDDHMTLPREVMVASMRSHQKYFSLLGKSGTAAPHFIFVADGITDESTDRVIAGNERVLRARLSDARHFWDQDRKLPLSAHSTKLSEIVFHAKLGTVDQRVDRLQSLAVGLTDFVEGADKDRVRSASRLAKADLVTEMVGEFPELQGTVGRYYAEADGEHDEVALAIEEHYSPAGPDDSCPNAPVSVAVALADKLDTLGSKDPFALRRAALGIIRLILENNIRIRLGHAFELARQTPAGADQELAEPDPGLKVAEVYESLTSFFADRLKVYLRDEGVPHDHLAAIFELPDEDDLVRVRARVTELSKFIETEDGNNLLSAYKRATNIVRLEEKKDGTEITGIDFDPTLTVESEEKALWNAVAAIEQAVTSSVAAENFSEAMAGLAKLRAPLDAFFEAVKVNVEDMNVRINRLRLLRRITSVMDSVAIFSKLDG